LNFDFVGNAVLAGAHSMYGQMLSPDDYRNLLSSASVSDAAAYLKLNTSYADLFEKALPGTLNRIQLEDLLRKKLFLRYLNLCKYRKGKAQSFTDFFILKNDMEQVVAKLHSLLGKTSDFFLSIPGFFISRSELDLIALANSKTYDELITVLSENESYSKLLAPFRGASLNNQTALDIELAFFRSYFEKLYSLAKKELATTDFKIMADLLSASSDLEALKYIFRLKSLGIGDEALYASIFPNDLSRLSKAKIKSLASCRIEDFKACVIQGPYAVIFEGRPDQSFEQAAETHLYTLHKKHFRFTANPHISMYCFIQLSFWEIRDITHVIEGLRYGLDGNKIKDLLLTYKQNYN
jgi:V/A-type H+-transporting ATPase subunit C